jgi:phosphoglucosamine mutase
VLSALKRGNQGLAECCGGLTLYPQTLINVRVKPGLDWTKNEAVVAEKEAVERELGDAGRVLIRPSGTEPLVRVMVEAKEAGLAEAMAKRIASRFEG